MIRADSDHPHTKRLLHRTEPHGEHNVYIVDEPDEPDDRIYEVRDSKGGKVSFLGSELESLCMFWRYELGRDLSPPLSLPLFHKPRWWPFGR